MLHLGELNEFWGIGGFAVGVIALILSVIFYIRGKKRKLLFYRITSTQLISKKITTIPGLSILLNGQPIENLSSTQIEFTNSGNQVINSSDFALLEPLSIVVDGQFYNLEHSCEVSSSSPNSIPQIESVNDWTANIKFDFLKPKQSITIALFHSGTILIIGELKDGKISGQRDYSKIISFISFALGIIFTLVSALLGRIILSFF